jgi:hypothetical protein
MIARTIRIQSVTVSPVDVFVVVVASGSDDELLTVQALGQQPGSHAYCFPAERKAHSGVVVATLDPGLMPGVSWR